MPYHRRHSTGKNIYTGYIKPNNEAINGDILKKIEIHLRNTTGGSIPLKLKKRWANQLKPFDDPYSRPFIIILGEILSILSNEETQFSGYKKTNTGIGEECWNLVSGKYSIYREYITELSESWQRVEILSNRTEIDAENKLKWDGDYSAFGGTRILLSGITEEEKKRIIETAEILFDEVKIK
jgi:hypothetical protein